MTNRRKRPGFNRTRLMPKFRSKLLPIFVSLLAKGLAGVAAKMAMTILMAGGLGRSSGGRKPLIKGAGAATGTGGAYTNHNYYDSCKYPTLRSEEDPPPRPWPPPSHRFPLLRPARLAQRRFHPL